MDSTGNGGTGCDRYRQELSARLDGADDPAGRDRVDRHVAGCPGCDQWYRDAATVTRLARVGLAVPVPGVSDAVLAAVPGRGRARLAAGARLLLAGTGAAQVLLGVAQLAVPGFGAQPAGMALPGAAGAHLSHESAAWNLAVGAGYLFIAWRRERPAGAIPILTAFVVTLTLLSLDDLIAGMVASGRLASHVLLLLGYALVVVLGRPGLGRDGPAGPSFGPPGAPRWRLDLAEDPVLELPAPGRLRVLSRHGRDRAA